MSRAEFVTTEFGTRRLILVNGGHLELQKRDGEILFLYASTGVGEDSIEIRLKLNPLEMLLLVEMLAIAARPRTGQPIIDELKQAADAAAAELPVVTSSATEGQG